MALDIVTAATATPISLSEAKTHLRLSGSDLDCEVLSLIQDATASVETILGAILMPTTVRLDMDCFDATEIDLAVYPVRSITTFVYDDADGVETTLVDGTDYWKDLTGKYPSVKPVTSWPSTMSGKPASVRITMEVGYATFDAVPYDIKRAIKVQIKQFFDFGNDWIQGIHATPLKAIDSLLAQHRRIGL